MWHCAHAVCPVGALVCLLCCVGQLGWFFVRVHVGLAFGRCCGRVWQPPFDANLEFFNSELGAMSLNGPFEQTRKS